MKATLTEDVSAQLDVIPTDNMSAYRAYRRAMEVLRTQGSFGEEELRLALEEAQDRE